MSEVAILTLQEWKAQGQALYGELFQDWRFKCPACHTMLYAEMYRGLADSPERCYTECIGRYVKDAGCNWAAYGLFQSRKTVQNKNNEVTHVFDFYDEDKLSGEFMHGGVIVKTVGDAADLNAAGGKTT